METFTLLYFDQLPHSAPRRHPQHSPFLPTCPLSCVCVCVRACNPLGPISAVVLICLGQVTVATVTS